MRPNSEQKAAAKRLRMAESAGKKRIKEGTLRKEDFKGYIRGWMAEPQGTKVLTKWRGNQKKPSDPPPDES
jgi:hypothetical protein